MTQRDLPLGISLSPRLITRIFVTGAVVNLFLAVTTIAYVAYARHASAMTEFVLRQLNLAAENRVAVWYSSMLLLLVALAALAAYRVDVESSTSRADRLLSLGWLALAALFAALSFDELASLHERLGWIAELNLFQGFVHSRWVGVLLIPGALIVTFLFAFAWLRVRRNWGAFALLTLGTLLFVTVPLQENLEMAARASGRGQTVVFRAIEEGTELFGTLCYLVGVLVYAFGRADRSASGTPLAGSARRLRLRLKPEHALATGMVLLSSAIVALIVESQPWFVSLRSQNVPFANWFPTAIALLLAMLAAYGARRVYHDSPGTRRALLLLAGACLVLSVEHGVAHLMTQELWGSSPRRRIVLDLLLSGMIVAAALPLLRSSLGSRMRRAAAVWAGMIVLGIFVGDPAATLLAIVAHARLLYVLVEMLAEGVQRAAPTAGTHARDTPATLASSRGSSRSGAISRTT